MYILERMSKRSERDRKVADARAAHCEEQAEAACGWIQLHLLCSCVSYIYTTTERKGLQGLDVAIWKTASTVRSHFDSRAIAEGSCYVRAGKLGQTGGCAIDKRVRPLPVFISIVLLPPT